MVVWKSGPNGKSEPISRRNNSLLRNLNASELTFVSCHALSSGGWEGSKEEQYIKLQMLSVPVLNPPKVVGQRGFLSFFFVFFLSVEGCIALPTQHVHTRQCHLLWELHTVDVIQEHTLALWPWEERWSREEWTMLPELARALTLSRPRFFSAVFVSARSARGSVLRALLLCSEACKYKDLKFCVHLPPTMILFVWCHIRSLSPSLPSVCYCSEKLSGVSASPV